MLATIKLSVFLLLAIPAVAQTYEEKIVASVLMGEAWGEGERGMTAVAEVISQRSKLRNRTPVQIVTARSGKIHAFSCMNGTSPERMVLKYRDEPVFALALKIAHIVYTKPESLPGITKQATHFTRSTEKPWWAKNKKAVAVIGSHSFYRMAL